MPVTGVSNADWFDGKCVNFLDFLVATTEKWGTHEVCTDTIKDRLLVIRDRCVHLKESDAERSVMFSKLARKKILESVPGMQSGTSQAIKIWSKKKDEQRQAYQDALVSLETFIKTFEDFLVFAKEHEEDILPDIIRLSGYVTLLFGDFVTTAV